MDTANIAPNDILPTLEKKSNCCDIVTDQWVLLDFKYDENWTTFSGFYLL